VAKAVSWPVTDAEARRLGEQTGLDTLVVLAVNDEHSVLGEIDPFSAQVNTISVPPGEYGRKIKTQRN
jgi:hypothetical protein